MISMKQQIIEFKEIRVKVFPQERFIASVILGTIWIIFIDILVSTAGGATTYGSYLSGLLSALGLYLLCRAPWIGYEPGYMNKVIFKPTKK